MGLDRLMRHFKFRTAREGKRKTGLTASDGLAERLARTEERLAKLEDDLARATGGYRRLLLRENPDILPELVSGVTVEALDRSLEAAAALTARLKKKLEEKVAAIQAPAGAPARSPPDVENLTPGEKIRLGLRRD